MNLIFKNALLPFIFCLIFLAEVAGQKNASISKADSLFSSKKYTEAFQVYNSIFTDGYTSPAVLIKMAFIKEGLGDYTQALYFLNLYYNQTHNKKALTKMRELAEEYQLAGYEYSDTKFIIGIIQEYKYHIILSLCSFILLIGAYIYRRSRQQKTVYTAGLFQLIASVLVLLLINNFLVDGQAIVTRGNTVAMTGPSAGAEPIEVIEKGNKVVILNKDEIWSKIKWHDQEVFVRSNSFKKI